MRSREEHLEMCKKFARKYLAEGDVENAITSMLSDLGRHPETKVNNHLTLLGMQVILSGDRREAERFIEGFR